MLKDKKYMPRISDITVNLCLDYNNLQYLKLIGYDLGVQIPEHIRQQGMIMVKFKFWHILDIEDRLKKENHIKFKKDGTINFEEVPSNALDLYFRINSIVTFFQDVTIALGRKDDLLRESECNNNDV